MVYIFFSTDTASHLPPLSTSQLKKKKKKKKIVEGGGAGFFLFKTRSDWMMWIKSTI
jgi:hypothetical protein